MFNHLFVNTRSTLVEIKKQVTLLARVVSFTAQILFIGYYIYLIVISRGNTPFFVTYLCLLAVAIISLIMQAIFLCSKPETRLEKRKHKETKRMINNILIVTRIIIKISAITLSGIELAKYPASDMQLAMFVISIMVFILYVIINAITYLVSKDIDMIRLSIESDTSESKILSHFVKNEKEYTEQEQQMIDKIKNKAASFLNKNKRK